MIVVIDDVRAFKPEVVANVDDTIVYLRSETEAMAFLGSARVHIDQLFLDHDLGWDTKLRRYGDIRSIVDRLCEMAVHNKPLDVEEIYVHTSNPHAGRTLAATLAKLYPSVRRISPTPYFTIIED